MNNHNVTPADLESMEEIARVSSWTAGKRVWTELAIYYRQGHARPFVAVVEGRVASGAVSDQDQRPLVPRFKSMPAGTLDRAFNWFEGSELRDRLAAAIPEHYEQRVTIDRAIEEATKRGVLKGAKNIADAIDRTRITHLPPGEPISMRIVGYPGPDVLAAALRWLYPDPTAGALARLMEEDFGMPARTVRHALSIEAGTTEGNSAPWVQMFITTLRCFDRELWMAGKSAKAATAE